MARDHHGHAVGRAERATRSAATVPESWTCTICVRRDGCEHRWNGVFQSHGTGLVEALDRSSALRAPLRASACSPPRATRERSNDSAAGESRAPTAIARRDRRAGEIDENEADGTFFHGHHHRNASEGSGAAARGAFSVARVRYQTGAALGIARALSLRAHPTAHARGASRARAGADDSHGSRDRLRGHVHWSAAPVPLRARMIRNLKPRVFRASTRSTESASVMRVPPQVASRGRGHNSTDRTPRSRASSAPGSCRSVRGYGAALRRDSRTRAGRRDHARRRRVHPPRDPRLSKSFWTAAVSSVGVRSRREPRRWDSRTGRQLGLTVATRCCLPYDPRQPVRMWVFHRRCSTTEADLRRDAFSESQARALRAGGSSARCNPLRRARRRGEAPEVARRVPEPVVPRPQALWVGRRRLKRPSAALLARFSAPRASPASACACRARARGRRRAAGSPRGTPRCRFRPG